MQPLIKINLRSPYSYYILGVKILLFVLLYLVLFGWWAACVESQARSLAEVWVIFKQQMLSQSFSAFFFYALPWVTGGIIAFVIFDFIQERKQHLPARTFKQLAFYPHEILLKTANPTETIVCPYKNTRFTLTVCPGLLPFKTLTVPFIKKITLIFQTEQNTFTIPHHTGFAGVRKIIENGKKFRSFTLQVQAEGKKPAYTENIYIPFLQKQLNNYRKKGLMLEYLPEWRVDLLLTAILDSAGGLMALAAYFWLVCSSPAFSQNHRITAVLLPAAGLLFLSIGIYLFNKWKKERACAKKLNK